MGYQFVHIQTYSQKLTKVDRSADQFNNTEQVFGEAEREAHYSAHVTSPKPPNPLLMFSGIEVAELRKFHDESRAAIRKATPQV